MMRARALIFDLDGVLANTAKNHYFAWKKLADEVGIDFSERDNERLKGVSRMRSLEVILERTSRSYSRAEKEALADRKNLYYREMISRLSRRDLLPGALTALQASQNLGIKLALASASKNAVDCIRRLQLEGFFDYIADANFVERPKPDPEIFLMAAQGLGQAPENCIGVEDSMAGILAIKKAGMYALGVGHRENLANADEVISSMEQFDPQNLCLPNDELRG